MSALTEAIKAKQEKAKQEDTKEDKPQANSVKGGEQVFYVGTFSYAFNNQENGKIKADAFGVYHPKNEIEVAILQHQVNQGLINFGVQEQETSVVEESSADQMPLFDPLVPLDPLIKG